MMSPFEFLEPVAILAQHLETFWILLHEEDDVFLPVLIPIVIDMIEIKDIKIVNAAVIALSAVLQQQFSSRGVSPLSTILISMLPVALVMQAHIFLPCRCSLWHEVLQ